VICLRCGDPLPLGDVLDHVRLMHPDDWDPQMACWPVEVC
jgi:hypothetical protein